TVDMATVEYWANHILAPVKFSDNIQLLYQQGFSIFLEIGAQPILTNLARQALIDDNALLLLPSIHNKPENRKVMLESLGALYAKGCDINSQNIYPKNTFNKLALPSYPFKRERFWLSEEESKRRS